ncbi:MULTISPECIES: hypothetical protein [Acinetobacter]|uniref:Uncharacterized protein n=2 Tax=Acinetobacter guillouiae TaxID=106649 RepID=N8YEH9_ACIGI|nr:MULTISPECIES: hypothetical protein [Acinetobacter]ENV17705.1 hypothetical protein F964_01009 [Acinetobacter guillouiae NIPH 991]KEC85727.1 hypothetical protein DT74_15245 [Acinetobacter sp. ETR1]MCF0265060.1 hypothetical protein [Acinetobacter guillouiae]MDI1221986.1 hypothetical protein [Acinetobacter sp.]MDO6644180.1 hypothetical protein [Acinetobacter guillouiae]
MQNQVLSLREKARRSFEARKSDHQARLTFLKDAKILDANGNFNDQFFAKSSSNSDQVRTK